MCAKSFSNVIKNKVKNMGRQCNLYADWNWCFFNVCLKDWSVRIVLVLSVNLFQSSGARLFINKFGTGMSVKFMAHLFLTKSIVSVLIYPHTSIQSSNYTSIHQSISSAIYIEINKLSQQLPWISASFVAKLLKTLMNIFWCK